MALMFANDWHKGNSIDFVVSQVSFSCLNLSALTFKTTPNIFLYTLFIRITGDYKSLFPPSANQLFSSGDRILLEKPKENLF